MSDDWEEEDWETNDVADNVFAEKLNANKDSWEEEEDELEIEVPEVAKVAESTLAAKAKALELKEKALANKVKYELEEEMTSEDRKLRDRKQVEEADHALTEELMGGGSIIKKTKSLGGSTGGLASISLNTKADHQTFGITISKKIENSTTQGVVAFMKNLIERLPANMSTESLDSILKVLQNERIKKAAKEGEVAKVVKKTSQKDVKLARKKHNDKFGGSDDHDEYYEQYGHLEDDFM
jgi:hypothetical protein